MSKYLNTITAIIFISLISQCAFNNQKNLRLTSILDEKVQPETTASKLILAPVFIPIGFVSFLIDVVLVHPIAMVADSAIKTYELVWDGSIGNPLYLTLLIIPKVILTPITFIVIWLDKSFKYHR